MKFKDYCERRNTWFVLDIIGCIGWTMFWCIIGYWCIFDGCSIGIECILDALMLLFMIFGWIASVMRVGFHLYERGVRFKHPDVLAK